MESPMTKYKGLKFLTILAFVIVVCVMAVAQSGNEDSEQKEVLTVQPTGQTAQELNEDSKQEDVPATQPTDQTAQESNENSKQEDVPATQPTDQAAQEPNEGSRRQVPLQQRMLKTISIDCINTPIEDVIRMIAEQADVDIIKSPSVTGNVTATLTNVPLGEALNNILAVHGYGCVIDKNMIRIAPIDEIAQKGETIESRVYRITYADVGEVENALKKFISKRGSISSNFGTSNIIVTDTASTIRAIDNFIDEIDRVTPQIMVEARIYDITSTDGFDIGAEWHAARNTPITTIEDTDVRQRIDTTVSPTNTWEQTITDTVDTIDPTNTGTITETTTTMEPGTTGYTITDTKTVEKDASTAWQDNDAGESTSSYTYKKSKPFVGGEFDADSGGTIRFGLLDAVDIELALNVLRSEVGAKLLANPCILVLDNETAEFKIISEIPYTETSQTSSGGSMTSICFKDVGVELKVTPHVTRGGMVRLHIIPEFGVVSEKGKLVGAVQTVPTVDTRKIDTKALIKDGQTVVIGGLRRRTVAQTYKKVPIFGDVPVLGTFFSNVTEEVKTNELLIFITPRVVTEPTLSPNERKKFKATEFSDPRVAYTGDERAEEAKK